MGNEERQPRQVWTGNRIHSSCGIHISNLICNSSSLSAVCSTAESLRSPKPITSFPDFQTNSATPCTNQNSPAFSDLVIQQMADKDKSWRRSGHCLSQTTQRGGVLGWSHQTEQATPSIFDKQSLSATSNNAQKAYLEVVVDTTSCFGSKMGELAYLLLVAV